MAPRSRAPRARVLDHHGTGAALRSWTRRLRHPWRTCCGWLTPIPARRPSTPARLERVCAPHASTTACARCGGPVRRAEPGAGRARAGALPRTRRRPTPDVDGRMGGWSVSGRSHPRRTDVRCARRARPRDPRGRAHAHVGGVVPRLRRRQDRSRRPQRRRKDHADEGAGGRPAAGRRQGRALGRAGLPSAGPAVRRPRDARAHPHPRCARTRHPGAADAGGVDADGGCRREGRREGDAPLRQPHGALRGARRLRPRRGGIHRPQPLSRTASSTSR
jgi:hypothetical protein